MEARLPIDKVQRILQFIEKLLGKSGCTKLYKARTSSVVGPFQFCNSSYPIG